MSIFNNRLKTVTTKVWDATQPDFAFPELADPELRVDGMRKKHNFGIAISGGGTRSATATLGQLRGLHKLGLLQKARYLSCVSGSSFTSTAYTYLPAEYSESLFLGPIVAPNKISEAHLEQTVPGSFAQAIANSTIADKFIINALSFAGDETYARSIGNIFLKPFGLASSKRFFSLDEGSLKMILAHNLKMDASDFYLTHPGRPFLVVNSIILRPDSEATQPDKIPVETTPLYAGVRPLFRGLGAGGRDIGGGYVEPFAFDSQAPEERPNPADRVKVRLGAARHRYTLADTIGTSGAAPAESMVEAGFKFLGFPEFRHWPLTGIGQTPAVEYEFGDGGNLENLALMPLLARGVRRIIVFVNTRQPLHSGAPEAINKAIPPIFGLDIDNQHNTVFPASKFQPLVEGLLAKKRAGKTLLHRDRYPVLENEFQGIKGGWEVELLWVYNDRVPAWEQSLPPQIQGLIGQDSLKNFPHYRTYGQNRPAIVDLKTEQVFLLANLSCWNIVSNADQFLSFLG